jgi:Uncharacterized flavoproteins
MTSLSLPSGTTIDEIADRIYRISTPVDIPGGGFSFNQYLIDDDAPLLFHTGLRRLFPVVSEAVGHIMPLERLRYISFSHFEADECGALNEFLAVSPQAEPLCGQVAALVSVSDYADRPAHALNDGEELALGQHRVRWFDGSIPRICRTLGNVGSSSRLKPPRCYAATCSPKAGRITLLSRPTTSWRPAKTFAAGWTISRTQRMRVRCWSAWRLCSREHWPACMAVHGKATAQPCCAPWRIPRNAIDLYPETPAAGAKAACAPRSPRSHAHGANVPVATLLASRLRANSRLMRLCVSPAR